MSINAASTSATSVSASSAQVSSTSSSDNTKKTSKESSFKDEMDKVSTKESKSDDKNSVESDKKVNEVSTKTDKDKSETNLSDKDDEQANQDPKNTMLEGSADYSQFASVSMNDINSMLSSDIKQMMNTNISNNINNSIGSSVIGLSALENSASQKSFSFSNAISLDQGDADFFVNLTQKNDVSMQNITTQAQNMVNNGADVSEVKKNVQVSQTLLNALSNSRENNQPIRIDFDQNVSVILRVGKDGAISANFIPGDKAVEQYLRNNMDSLKATFNQNDLPYSDLSYSNRGSRQQKENRRNNKQ